MGRRGLIKKSLRMCSDDQDVNVRDELTLVDKRTEQGRLTTTVLATVKEGESMTPSSSFLCGRPSPARLQAGPLSKLHVPSAAPLPRCCMLRIHVAPCLVPGTVAEHEVTTP